MIAFQAQGGLGNQMFQYATARRLALRYRCPLVLDHYWFDHPRIGETARPLELTRYPVEMRLASPLEMRMWSPIRSRWGRYFSPLMPMKVLREHGYGVNRSVLSAQSNSYLLGFWQSESYFADIRKQLLLELTPKIPPSPLDQVVIAHMRRISSISVHVRRGDYVTLESASKYHGLCTLEYYSKAIEYIGQRVEEPYLFVFSDDPEWARNNLQFQFPTEYVDHNSSDTAFQDLRLMSHCKHHIIANSSFSWWGAWLSDSPNQVVVAPAKWYNSSRPTPDLLPAHWVCL
jgi:hypothetical protein